MKKIGLLIGILLFTGNAGLFAQGNNVDAYTLSNTELNGTARSMSMAGAFGALGGDISVLSSNPAGLGIYRSSEISGTLDLSMVKASSDWSGITMDRNKTRFAPNNFGFTLYFPTSSGSVRNWNLGFSYNRLKNYKRSYRMSNNGGGNSMADYAAWRTSNAFGYGDGISQDDLTYIEGGSYDPYYNRHLAGHSLSILGFESGMFENYVGRDGNYQSSFGDRENNGDWTVYSPYRNALIVNESGHMDEYNIGFGLNVSNFLFLGASLSVTDIDYKYSSYYDENYVYDEKTDDYLYLDNSLNTEGTAFSVNVGAIVNLQMLRLGVAYNSPRWYDMTDYYAARAGTVVNGYGDDSEKYSQTPLDEYSEYSFRTPEKWIFSGAVILGQSALISADYEMTNYKNMQYSDRDGDTYGFGNEYIESDYTWGHTLKIGTEIKVDPQFAVRAGYMMQTSPMKEHLANNDAEILPAGTLPHFTVTSKPTNYYTVGFGYRFTPNFYMDLACIYRYNSAHAYAFSNTYNNDAKVDIQSDPAKLKTKSTRVALTLGYKF